MTQNAMTSMTNEDLKALAGMANKEEAGVVEKLPVMKINFDEDSIHPRGVWIVGQHKAKPEDGGHIIEHGELVKSFMILAIKDRFSYYVEKEPKKNCHSPMFNRGDVVRGSNYGHVCGKTCPYRAEGIDPRCQAQKVVFASALTDKGLVDCVAYLKGSNYMPFVKYIEEAVKYKDGSKSLILPTYAFPTIPGPLEKLKQGTVTYWVASWLRGPLLSLPQVRELDKKREAVMHYIDAINAKIEAGTPDEGEQEPAPARTATAGAAPPATMTADPVGVARDITPATVLPAEVAAQEMPPWDSAPASAPVASAPAPVASAEDDIAAAIERAMASNG